MIKGGPSPPVGRSTGAPPSQRHVRFEAILKCGAGGRQPMHHLLAKRTDLCGAAGEAQPKNPRSASGRKNAAPAEPDDKGIDWEGTTHRGAEGADVFFAHLS